MKISPTVEALRRLMAALKIAFQRDLDVVTVAIKDLWSIYSAGREYLQDIKDVERRECAFATSWLVSPTRDHLRTNFRFVLVLCTLMM